MYFFYLITKDRCSDFNQQRPPLTEGGLPVIVLYLFNQYSTRGITKARIRACLHGGGGPQVGVVTRLGGVTRLSI